jgi:hypothetical protein
MDPILTVEKINFAIQDCMSECTLSKHPLTCLAGFLAQLKDLRHWPDDEIHEVDNAVRHLLAPVIFEVPDAALPGDGSETKGAAIATDMDQVRPD